MNIGQRAILTTISCGLTLLLYAASVTAEDIDIFVGGSTGDVDRPNIIFVLDNTANWSRQSQHWPGGLAQGQSEVRAIKTVLEDLTDKVNVGFMMFTTQGNANQNGGYVRHHLQQLTDSSKTTLAGKLDTIFGNINSPVERRNANEEYGYLIRDVYQYLIGGDVSYSGDGTPGSLADNAAYTTTYSKFSSPLTSADICADTHVVFISNPNNNGPATDDAANSAILRQLYTDRNDSPAKLARDSTGTPIAIPKFTNRTTAGDMYAGYSSVCYNNANGCNNNNNNNGCKAEGFVSCSCTELTTEQRQGLTAAGLPACTGNNTDYFWITGQLANFESVPTGLYDTESGEKWNLDDWARFMHVHGIAMPDHTDTDGTVYRDLGVRVTTHTIDVFRSQQNADHTGLMMSTARVGGGSYFAARSEADIVSALQSIISDILSVNSTFASAALPISATNRAQNENQVFIGMFRPDPDANPSWFGNLKRYQVARFDDGIVDLADVNGMRAVNMLSGFVAECAKSWWTDNSDPLDYWANLGISPPPKSQCAGTPSPWSDLPDGPFVEKGAVAQRLREREDVLTRNIQTLSDTSPPNLVTFNQGNTGLATDLVRYVYGLNADDTVRPGIHGDVIHSRPLPINYGGSTGIVVYYGANDGLLRGVRSSDGEELWGFIHPEHFSNNGKHFARLRDNNPKVFYPDQAGESGNRERKDYFFDGLIGQIVSYDTDNKVSRAWIYPSMRRGGRMLYAFNVTNPLAPQFMWRKGCTDDTDSGCDSGFEDIGQTWSVPNGAFIQNDGGGSKPVIIMGGGYDTCEDEADTDLPDATACTNTKGNVVYVLDAEDGTLIKQFPTERAVAADVRLVDLDYDGKVDLAYAADTGGNLYRIDLRGVQSLWRIDRIAFTAGGHRKFLNGPAVFPLAGYVYLALGTGNRERPLETNYPYVHEVQNRFYVFRDNPANAVGTSAVDLDGDNAMWDFSAAGDTGCDTLLAPSDASQGQQGWFMDLPHRGEQVVTNALFVGDKVTFSTTRPGGAAVGLCSRPIGIAEGYWLNIFNGQAEICADGGTPVRSGSLVGGGIPPSPVLATVSLDDGRLERVIIGAADIGQGCPRAACGDDLGEGEDPSGDGGGSQPPCPDDDPDCVPPPPPNPPPPPGRSPIGVQPPALNLGVGRTLIYRSIDTDR